MNHHELLAGVPGVRRVVQGIARQIAGVGRLATLAAGTPGGPQPGRRRQVDVLVVGAGGAGMAATLELSKRGRRVEIVDDDLVAGGGAGLLARLGEPRWSALVQAFDAVVAKGSAVLRTRTTAAGVYGDDVLVANDAGTEPVEVVTARTLVLAVGCHDGVLAFEGNDLPGILSARAGCRLLVHGVTPGRRVALVGDATMGPFGAAFARLHPQVTRVAGLPLRATGRARVKGVVVLTGPREREVACDALLLDAPPSPAYTLPIQAGASVARTRAGFVVKPGPGGRIRDRVFVLGEACGTELEPDAMTRAAGAMAELA